MDDIHSLLADHAYQELKEITGKDFGYKRANWKKWLQKQSLLEAKPYYSADYIY